MLGQGEEHQNQQGEKHACGAAAKRAEAHAAGSPPSVSRPHHPGTPEQGQHENQGKPQRRTALCRKAGGVLEGSGLGVGHAHGEGSAGGVSRR